MKLLFYDLETSGLDPKRSAILQMAIIIEYDGKVVEESTWDMAPHKGANIETRALEVNGIDPGDLYHRPDPVLQYQRFKKVLDRHVDKFNKGDKMTLAGYNNSQFDDPFLREFFKRNEAGRRFSVFGSYFTHFSLDARHMITWLHHCGQIDRPDVKLPDLKLTNVCFHLGIPLVAAHDALADVRATRILVRRLLRVINNIDDLHIAGIDAGIENWIAKELTSTMADEEDPGIPMSKEMVDDGVGLTPISKPGPPHPIHRSYSGDSRPEDD